MLLLGQLAGHQEAKATLRDLEGNLSLNMLFLI